MSRKSAFSLVEVITVTVIVPILILIALPSFIESKTASELSLARIRLTAMKAAMENHLADWGMVPSVFSDPNELMRKSRGEWHIYGYNVCPISSGVIRSKGGLEFVGDPSGVIGSKQRTFYASNIHCPLTSPVRYISDTETVDPFSNGTIPFGLDSYVVDDPDRLWNHCLRWSRQDRGPLEPRVDIHDWMPAWELSGPGFAVLPHQWQQELWRVVDRCERLLIHDFEYDLLGG